MILNSHVGPVRTQIIDMQKMNNSVMSTQKTPTSNVCLANKSESKRIKADKSKFSYIFYGWDRIKKGYSQCMFFGKIESKNETKSAHKSVNTSEVKDAMNETKDEELSVTDHSFVNAPRYFKLL